MGPGEHLLDAEAEKSGLNGIKNAITIATSAAKQALEGSPDMAEVSVEYQGVKITLKRDIKKVKP